MKFLRPLRIIVATVFFAGLLFAFLNFRGDMPIWFGKILASMQSVPPLMSFASGVAVSGVILAVLLVITLLFGRVYCSAICPLGIFQDVVRRIRMLFPKKKKALQKYQPAKTIVRQIFFWLVAISFLGGFFVGGFGILVALLDPYSIFGRMVTDLFQPVAVLINNALAGIFNAQGIYGIYYLRPNWFGFGIIALPLAFFVLITVMSAMRGRLYCNTVCPVGTFLGFLAKRGAFRLEINESRCRRCTQCQRQCKAECIDSRQGVIDMSRCVACYDCIKVCDDNAISYKFAWKKQKTSAEPTETPVRKPIRKTASASGTDWSKRGFINSVVGGSIALGGSLAFMGMNARRQRNRYNMHAGKNREQLPIFPAGAQNIDRFLDCCTACHLCVTACPTQVLQPAFMEYGLAGFMKPHFDLALGFCNFECTKCAEACPTDAIRHIALEQKKETRIGLATFHEKRCIVVTDGTDCAACSEHCPTKAVDTIPYKDNLLLPKVNAKLCIGCGACEHACPVRPDRAITVSGIMEHEVADKAPPKKAVEVVPDEFLF